MFEILLDSSLHCNEEKLIKDLESLAITGVRTYSVLGAGGIVYGVYAWDANAPLGEYHHIEVQPEDVQRIKDVIITHSFNNKKQIKIDTLNNTCEKTILSGFTSSVLGAPHIYGFSTYDQMNLAQQAIMILSDINVSSIDWKTEDAGVLTHTRDQFLALSKDAETHKRNNITKYWTLKAQVQAATTEEEINAIIW